MPLALFSPPIPAPFSSSAALSAKTHLSHGPHLALLHRKNSPLLLTRSAAADNGPGTASSAEAVAGAVVEEKKEKEEETPPPPETVEEGKKKEQEAAGSNGTALNVEAEAPPKFKDPRWVGGTWDLKLFGKDGKIGWDAVIDAEARRRKWLEDNPEASSNDEPVVFDTSVIPWWAWVQRFHLPEAELLNGRAAMVGFFMAYFVDSLTGLGLVDQMGNFFCKTLLFVAVSGVLLIRKNEDIETLKKLLEETTFYDKQWKATWQDDKPDDSDNV